MKKETVKKTVAKKPAAKKPIVNPISKLIAQWRDQQVSGSSLMRALVSFDKWCVPISDQSAIEALAQNTNPSLILSEAEDGTTGLLVFSSSDALFAYRKAVGLKGSQHYLTVHGTWVFGTSMDEIDELWIDAKSPDYIYYKKPQFTFLREMVQAIKVEQALVALRKGTPADDAIQVAREYKNYYMAVAKRDDKLAYIMAPDTKGRSLAAAFTSDDTFEAFVEEAQQLANGAEVQQMQVDGAALFDTFKKMDIDGFVFNCKGPIPPVAFQQAAASIILEG